MRVSDFYITPEEYEQAAKNGVCRKTLEVRIRNYAWDKARAINTPPAKRRAHGSLKEWATVAKQNGIAYDTFLRRLNRFGWPVERAATEPLVDPKALMDQNRQCNRKYPVEIIQQAETNGIPYGTFLGRMQLGWSQEEASTKPVMTRREAGLMTKAKCKQHRL